MALDHSDPSVVYVSKPTDGLYGTVYEIWELKMNGTEIASEKQITINSEYNNVRPFVAWGSSEDDLIRLTWMNGNYYYWIANSTYPDAFPTSIMTDAEIPDVTTGYGIDKLTIPEVITSDYMLPTVAADGTAITWTSSDSNVIDPNGYVTMTNEDKTVVLTAENEYGSKQFNVTVPARDVLNNNMILGYEFETDDVYTKNNSRYVRDISGNGNDAAIYGSCAIDGELDLTENTTDMKTNSYAAAPDGVLEELRSYTFSLKVNAEHFNSQPRFYDFGSGSSNSVFLRGDELAAGIKYNNGTTALLTPDVSLSPNTEYHLAVTFDAKTKTTKIYLNGDVIAEGSNLVTEPYLLGENSRNYIGRTQWWDNSTEGSKNADFCGTIDDFYMFNTALTAEEINELYTYESERYGADITVDGENIKVDIKNADNGSVVIAASYNDQGEMISASVFQNNTVEFNSTGVKTVKVFCFESLENLKPLHSAISKNL